MMVSMGRITCASRYSADEYSRLMSQMPLFAMRGDALTAYVEKMVAHGVVYVLTDDDRLLGLVGFYANDKVQRAAYLSSIVVDSSLRGSGWGKRLFDEMIAECIRAGMKTIAAEVVKSNRVAIDFYLRNGFTVVGEAGDELRYSIRRDL